jgi:hypothetical protein
VQQVSSRRLLGVGAIVAVGLISELLPSGPSPTLLFFGEQHVFLPTVWDFLASFAVFALGAYVSRTRFMPVAISFAILIWVLGQYTLYQIALPTGQADILSITVGNVPSLLMIMLTAALGTVAGEQLFGRRSSLSSGTS